VLLFRNADQLKQPRRGSQLHRRWRGTWSKPWFCECVRTGHGECPIISVLYVLFNQLLKEAKRTLGLSLDDTIVIDVGHCSGRFCFSCSALGLESIGIGEYCSNFYHQCHTFNVFFLLSEVNERRWALSVEILARHIAKGRLTSALHAPVTLLNVDARELGSLKVMNCEKKILVYCWDRGLGPEVFTSMADAALRASNVAGG
jgi:hypothetical protein